MTVFSFTSVSCCIQPLLAQVQRLLSLNPAADASQLSYAEQLSQGLENIQLKYQDRWPPASPRAGHHVACCRRDDLQTRLETKTSAAAGGVKGVPRRKAARAPADRKADATGSGSAAGFSLSQSNDNDAGAARE